MSEFWWDMLVGWGLLFFGTKLLIVPPFRWMWRSMKATEELDRADAAWLAAREAEQADEDGGARAPARWRRPRPRRPDGEAARRRERARS